MDFKFIMKIGPHYHYHPPRYYLPNIILLNIDIIIIIIIITSSSPSLSSSLLSLQKWSSLSYSPGFFSSIYTKKYIKYNYYYLLFSFYLKKNIYNFNNLKIKYIILYYITVKPYNKKLCHCRQILAAFLMGTGAIKNFSEPRLSEHISKSSTH